MSASLGSGRTPTGFIGIGSDKSTIVCSFVNSDGTPSQMGVKHYCLKGGQADTAQFGCYGEKPANACKAAGTNYLELMDGEDVPTGTKGLFCLDGCQMKVPGTVACVQILNQWSCYAGGPGWITYTGSECTGNESDMPSTGNDPLPTDCKAGTCPGTINGNAVCVPCGDGGIGDGGGSTGGGSGSGDGGTGSGTGTGSGDGGGSGTGGSGTGTGGGGNGDDNGGSDWGGDCKLGFTCEGDALVCAISQASHVLNCGLLEDPKQTDEYKLYGTERGTGEAPEFGAIGDALPGADINVGDYFKTDNLLGSGRCMADKKFTWNGRTFTIPLSDLCDLFKWLGLILQSVALLWGMRIAFGGGV
ncbi:virulence factor TspB C-terminal domain-related protein [Saezia sanguinis]|nr:virulence factor TspB C-terminal domain-related protein [Saezia sanguinis]